MRLTCVCIIAMLGVTVAWWDEGHMVVSQIAYNTMSEASRTKYLVLLSDLNSWYPNASTPLLVGAWLDDVKGSNSNMNSWHYKDMPVFDDSYTGTRDIPEDGENILWAIQTATETIGEEKNSPIDRAFALRVVIHLVGDLHQPLHTVSRYSAAHPQGDWGGNAVHYLDSFGNRVKLHGLWDNASGYFEESPYCCYPNNVRDDEFVTYLTEQVALIEATECPASVYSQNLSAWRMNVEHWYQESVELAKQAVYATLPAEDTALSAEYLDSAKQHCVCQMQLGGSRLGALLDHALSGDHSGDESRDVAAVPPPNEVAGIVIGLVLLALAMGLTAWAFRKVSPINTTALPVSDASQNSDSRSADV